MNDVDRRAFLRVAGLASVGLAAGCSGNGGSGGSGADTPEPTPTPTEGSDGSGSSGGSGPYDGWLSDVDNFDGVVDRTGQSEVTVTVGAEGNGGNFAFEPPAIEVDTGTTVVWEWNGQGGQHNVKAEEGADFESDLASEEGYTFEYTFDSAGVVTYVCTPHRSLGMKGVVDVQ